MWINYNLEMSFTGRLMGGVPKHPSVIQSWLEARAASPAAYARMENPTPLPELVDQVIEEVDAEATEENKVWCGFKNSVSGPYRGLYVDGYHVKSHLKDAANTLQRFLGIKALKSKLADRLFILQDRLYLGVTEPSGYWEHPVHVMTPQGARSALKRADYVDGAFISAKLSVLEDGVITEALLRQLLDFGSVRGFGAERGLGFGRYTWKLTNADSRESQCLQL